MDRNLPVVRPPLPPGIKLDENVYITMRDGVKICADVYRPEVEGRYPALLSTSAYLKHIQLWPGELSHSIEAGATRFFVPKGYVHVIVQVRGCGLSQGEYNWYDSEEQQDGYELVEWIAQQPWCNGNVGMMGDSYFGRTQWLIAALKPPHLKCINPYDAGTDDYRDSRFMGGVVRINWLGQWGFDTMLQALWPGPVEGKLPPANMFNYFGANPEDGPYYWERSAWPKIGQIDVPVLNIAINQGPGHSIGQLREHPNIEAQKKLVVIPPAGFYSHVFLQRSLPLNELLLRWFDYWLKGIDTGIMDLPPVSIYDSGTGEWRHENEYPLARTEWTKFYLRSNPAGPSKEPPYGLISREQPKNEEPDRYGIQEEFETLLAGKPVLAYATPPLEEDLRVWGPFSVVLYGSSTTLDTAWFVKVGDVAPDGKVSIISFGILRASFREVDKSRSKPGQPFHPFRNPVLPEPNEVYEYQIEMVPIFHTFKAGHKLWVQVASNDFEWQTLHHTIYTAEMLPVPATNTILHDAVHASHLMLPVIPDAPVIKPVEPPLSEVKWPMGDTAMPPL